MYRKIRGITLLKFDCFQQHFDICRKELPSDLKRAFMVAQKSLVFRTLLKRRQNIRYVGWWMHTSQSHPTHFLASALFAYSNPAPFCF